MTFLRLLPAILSSLVLAAHFLRNGQILGVMIFLAAPWVLLIRESWAARLVQILLLLGSLEWIRTMAGLMEERKSQGEPWIRMAAILTGVALFTLISALLFQGKRLKERYSVPAAEEEV
jgi:hypothetical protein